MPNWFDKIFGSGKQPSGTVAKERLQLLLVHERSNLTPEQVRAIKDEILEVIARYVEFDPQAVSITLDSQERDSILHAEIPILPMSQRKRHPAPAVDDA